MPVKDVIRKIYLNFHKKAGFNLNMTHVKLVRPSHPTNCLTLDLTQIRDLDLTDISQIKFSFKNIPKYQVEVKMEDRLYSVSRAYKYNKFRNLGSRMDLPKSSKNMIRYYVVKFNQKKLTENDPGKKCKNYITTSFNDCDDQFIKDVLKRKAPAGFMPVWATDNLASVTTSMVADICDPCPTYSDLISGIAESSCPPPCTSTEITSIFLDEKCESVNYSRIDITISDSVSFTVTDFPSFNPALFLSVFGGSMGMWLGLGVAQTIEMVLNLAWRMKRGRQ